MKLIILVLAHLISLSGIFASPNVILILTDDLDLVLHGLDPLEKTRRLVGDKGAVFEQAFTTSPICCPSRASILTGKYAHNHGTLNNSRSGGCYSSSWVHDIEPLTLPSLLKFANYETFFAGKYLNQYHSKSVPPGWDHFYGLQGNSKYYDYKLNENGKIKQYGSDPDSYLTSVIREKAISFLMNVDSKQPFFAMLSVPSPHDPFTPEERYANHFPNITALKTESFNRGPGFNEKHWLLTMLPSELDQGVLDNLDKIYRMRWQSLLSVDNLVEDVVITLSNLGVLNDTYIIFTSDNGFHIGQHAQPFDKRQPYETDINIPLLIRGPGIKPKTAVEQPAALIDLVPTILTWTDVPFNIETYDGVPLNDLFNVSARNETYERHILIEYWGEFNDDWVKECPWSRKEKLFDCKADADCKCQDSWNNTYTCVRHLANDINFIYCRFKDFENYHEAYDLFEDPHQLNNIAYEILPSEQARYNIIIDHLSDCSGYTCRRLYY